MKEPVIEYPDHVLLKAVQKLPNREDGKRQVAFQIAANLPERGKYTTAQVVAIWRRELRAVRDDPNIAQYWIGAVTYLTGPTAGGMEGSFMKIIRNYHAFYKEVLDKSGEQAIGELGDRSFIQVDGFDPDPEASTAEATLPASAITSYGRAL